MKTICACLIVKNEAAVIQRCLESVRDHISHWVIVDTGSTDDTVAIIERELAGIPGSLHHSEWVDFGHNRTENLRLARGTADYLLIIDADEQLQDPSGLALLGEATSYLVSLTAGSEQWWSKRVLRDDLDWRYEPEVHAIPVTDHPDRGERLDGVRIHHYNDGGCKAGRMPWLVSKLKEKLEREPNDARSVFYLAQTLRDMQRYEDALPHFQRRATMGGWAEEAWYAQYRAGQMLARLDRWPEAVEALTTALDQRPGRLEPVYELALGYRMRGQRQAAHAWAAWGAGKPRPADTLFVADWVYQWGLLFELSIAAYWTGDYATSVAVCDQLLEADQMPLLHKAQTMQNRQLALRAAEPAGLGG